MWVTLQENLIIYLWQNDLWLVGIVKGKESKSYVIWGLFCRIFFYAAKKQYVVIFSNDPAWTALEKSTGLGRRWILKVFAAWGVIMVKWGSPIWQRIIVTKWVHRGIKWKRHKNTVFPDVGPCREAKNVVLLPITHVLNNFDHHSNKVQTKHKGKYTYIKILLKQKKMENAERIYLYRNAKLDYDL